MLPVDSTRFPSNMGLLRWPLIFAAAATAAAKAVELDNGLIIDTIIPVTCDRPAEAGDLVTVDYEGTLNDGQVFGTTYKPHKPFVFDLGGGHVITGLDKGVEGMCVGEERNITVPSMLGYGGARMGIINPGSTLYFDLKLLGIDGVGDVFDLPSSQGHTADKPQTIPDLDDPTYTSTAPQDLSDDVDLSSPEHSASGNTTTFPSEDEDEKEGGAHILAQQRGECKLLGPFALFVQAGLGVLALFSLVWKRWRERPRRPVKIWFFDASKQVLGTALLHLANLAMSMLSSGDLTVNAVTLQDDDGNIPNPCSFYLINIFVDTTVGILFLYLILKVLHRGCAMTPLANPPESIRSGNYGQPPRVTWWLKQLLIYFIALFLMKLCVFLLFKMLPWIAWVGAWALRWTEGDERLQIAFVMFVFPLIMNAIQYYLIDSFIKDKTATEKSGGSSDNRSEEYEPIARHSDSDDFGNDDEDEAPSTRVDRPRAVNPEPVKEVTAPRSPGVSPSSAPRRQPKPKNLED